MRAATFTTYINAQTDPGLEQAFTRQAQIATSSYATITRAAEQATRATAGLLGARGTTGAGVGTQAFQQRAAAIRTAGVAAAEAERATTRLATATRREAAATQAAARDHRALAGGLTTTATALNVVSGRLDPVSSRISTLSRAVTDLTGVQLGLAAFGATLFALGRTANTFANLEARVRPFFETQTQVNAAMNDIIGIAQRSRSALEPVVDVYTRLTTVGQNIGLSARGIGQITEIATKAAAVGGGTAQARDAALMQFGQALSGDFKAAGQEINSLKEQAPILFQAILRGYKDVDGTVGVTLGRFKQMAEAGELSTEKVLDAVRRSASYIDQMASRVPNTLSRAGTDFSNSLTTQVGRFDQAIGFTSTLADGLSLVARNLRVITALAAGAATTFAAIKVVGLVQEGAAAVRTTLTMRAAIEQLGIRRQQNAAASAAQHQREIAALNAEQVEIRQNIALLERQRAVAARNVVRYQPDPVSGYAGSNRRVAQAAQEERVAVRALTQERQRLAIIQNAGIAANARAAASSTALAAATANVTGRVGAFRSALGGVVNFLGGPWMIAFAVATTAVYLLATAESAAEKATKAHEEAQRSFSNVIDRATGKIYDQVDALTKLDVARKNQVSVDASLGQASESRRQLLQLAQNFTDPLSPLSAGGRVIRNRGNSAAQNELRSAAEAFARGDAGSYNRFAATVERLAKSNSELAKELPRFSSIGEQFGTQYQELRSGRARRRILAGRPQDGDTALALGEEPRTTRGTGGARPRTRAQIEAAAAQEAASTEVERARANLKALRAQVDTKTGLLPGRDDVQTQHELAAAMQAVTAASTAQAAARRAESAGRAQARKDARDAIQDARDEAAAKRDAALLDLSKQGLNPNSDAFLQARIKILQTYDEEVNKLDASRAASSGAAAQMIADANRVAAAAATAGEKRRDILAAYDEAPRARDRANDQIEDLQRFVDTAVDGAAFLGKTKEQIDEIKKSNPLGTGIYTQEMADADARRINEGVRKPLTEMNREYERGEEIARLQLQGRDTEAAALQRRYTLLDGAVELEEDEYQGLIRNERQQLRINDALASRQRVVSAITGSLESARDTAESVFTGLQTGGSVGNIFKTALNDFRNQFARIQSRQLVERLFAGSDEKLRALLEGRSVVDTAIGKFGSSVDTLSASTGRGETAVDRFTTALENATDRINAAGGGVVTDASGTATSEGADITVVGRPAAPRVPLPTSVTPSARAVYNQIGTTMFAPVAKTLDGLLGRALGRRTTYAEDGTQLSGPTFFRKIGDSFGTALEGAGKGAIASGFAKALGIKQSGTGAQIGGALGALSGIPGGAIIGGLLGGTVGGLFKKTKQASSTLTINDVGELTAGAAVGRGSNAKQVATGLGGNVVSGLDQIAEALGAKVSGAGSVSIGYRPGHKDPAYRVDTTGQGRLTGVQAFETEQEAINFAIQDALKDGVITGITEASKKILASGQDLQRALAKATVIESIPKRLMQITDPVRYAVTTLNEEFEKMISYLKEGGATAEQFADAQKLYDLERAEAIKQATSEAADAINDFLKEMTGGSSSPYSKKTVYDNAASELASFQRDIASGKAVDQQDLLNVARNFQDASRERYGSSAEFFADFEMLRKLLEKARDNAGTAADVSTLPASPFEGDKAVQAAIASLQGAQASATQSQTQALSTKLDQVISAIERAGVPVGGTSSRSALGILPGFADAA